MGENQAINMEDLFKSIYNDSPIGIEIYDSYGKLIDLNQSCMDLFGVSSTDEVKGFDLLDDPNIPKEHLNKLKQRETIQFESSFDFDLVKKQHLYETTKSGKTYLKVLITPIFLGKDNSLSNYLVQIQDIGEQKKGEQKLIDLNEDLEEIIEERANQLKESEEKYRTLIKSISDIIFKIDLDGKIDYLSPQTIDILGYKPEEMINQNAFRFIHLDDQEEVLKNQNYVINTGEVGTVEFRIQHKEGHYITVSLRGQLIEVDNKKNIVGLFRDITERKKIEEKVHQEREKAKEKIRESEKKLMDLIESIPVGISITTHEGKVLECNSQAFQIFGYSSKEEFLSVPVINLYQDPSDREKFLELYKKGLVKDFEVKFKRKDGTVFWGSLTSVAYNKGDQTLFINSFQDITNRKITKIKIQQSETELSAIYNYTPIAILLLDSERRIRKINKFALKFTDRREEEVFGIHGGEALRCVYSIKDPQGCGFSEHCQECTIRNTVLDTFKNKIPHINVEATLFLLPGGDIDKVHLLFSTVPLKFDGEDLVLVSLIDITDRKKAEQKLKESEARYRNLFENSPIGLFEQDFSELKIYIDNLRASGVIDFEKYLDENPKEIINFGSMIKLIDVNRKTLELYNVKNKDYFIDRKLQMEKNLFQFMTPEVLITNKREMLSFIYGETTFESELVITNSFGDTINVYMRTLIIPGFESTWSKVIVSLLDITDRVVAEQELKKSEGKYRKLSNQYEMLLESITDAVYALNRDWEYILVNKNAEKIINMPIENLLGNKIIDVFPGIEQTTFFKTYKNVMNTGKANRIIDSFKLPNGHAGYFEVNVYPIKEGILCIGKNATEEKEIERKLKESEERFKYLVSSNPAIIYTSKASGNYGATFISDNVEDKWGYEPDYFVKDSEFWLNHIHADDKEHVLTELSKLFDKGHITHEYRFKLNNGTYQWMRDEVMLMRDDSGNPVEIIGSVIDITDRVKAEEKLKESEEKFRTIAEQSLLGLSIIQNGFVVFTNQALSNILGYSVEEINQWSGKDTFKVIYEEDLPNVRKKVKTRKKDDLLSMLQYQCRINTKSGNLKWVEVISKPIIYQGRIGTILSLIDITTKKEVEDSLKEISRVKSELLSRTSHELKTPLVSIKGYADLLLTQHYEELDIYTVSVLHEIKQGSYRLESLITDLLETSKLESEEIKLNKLEDDLAFLIRFCIRDLKGLIETRKHKLVLDIHDKMITMFEKEKIYEVLMNLISNAIKYTPPNGLIIIKSEKTEKKYIISVKDNGIGLTDYERKKIFKKFGKIERYGKGMNVVSEGSGLGLYISKKIIELHEEDIWVESEGRDKGSIFYFSLPNMKD